MKPLMSIFAMAIIVVLSIILISPVASGQTNNTSLTYQGVSDGYAPASIRFSTENPNLLPYSYVDNGSVLYEPSSFNLTWTVRTLYSVYSPSGQDTVNTLFLALSSVSYKASWQGNKPTELYNYYIPSPAIWTGNPPNSQSSFSYSLTNMPCGHQQIQVTASCGGYEWGIPYYNSFSTTNSLTLDFSVEAQPTISVNSPENQTYHTNSLPFLFKGNGDYATMGYSIDGLANVTNTGDTTLTGLSFGSHSLTAYASDTFGNTIASKTIYFTISQQSAIQPFLASIVIIIFLVIAFATLVSYRQRKPRTRLKENKIR